MELVAVVFSGRHELELKKLQRDVSAGRSLFRPITLTSITQQRLHTTEEKIYSQRLV